MFLGGTQQLVLQDAESQKSSVFQSVRKGAISAVACVVICVPQQAYSDPPSSVFHPLRAGKPPSESTFVRGTPQLADLTQQAFFQEAVVAGKRPRGDNWWHIGAPQPDPSQLAAAFWDPVSTKAGSVIASKYSFGLHAAVFSDAEGSKTSIFAPARGPVVPKTAAEFVGIGPQPDPTQLAASVWEPNTLGTVSGVPAAEYSWGGHAQALHAAEAAKSEFFQPTAAPSLPKAIGEFVGIAPQVVDLTLQGTFQEALGAGSRPTSSPTILGGPLPVDLTQQADIALSWMATQQGRVPPTTLGAPQSDPNQLEAQLVAPATPAVGGVPAVEYSWGTHELALGSAEAAKTKVFPSARSAVIASPVNAFVVGAPLQQDLSLQAQFDSPGLLQGAVPPITVGTPQTDPSQILPFLWQSAVTKSGSAAGAQYNWGTHAAALDVAEALKSRFFSPAIAGIVVVVSPVARFVAVQPQIADLTEPAWFDVPSLAQQGPIYPSAIGIPQENPSQVTGNIWGSQPASLAPPAVSGVPASEYSWGTHAIALASAESLKSRFFTSARTPQGTISPFMAGVSEVVDVVAQASFGTPLILTPPPVGPVFGKWVQGAPQLVDLTLQASFSTSLILVPPVTGRVPAFDFSWDLHAVQLAAAEGAKTQLYQALSIGGVAPLPPAPPPTTIGGIERWTIQIPQLTKKKKYVFKRNMENLDRQDLEDIAALVKAWLDKDRG